jgi:hypothetical protein
MRRPGDGVTSVLSVRVRQPKPASVRSSISNITRMVVLCIRYNQEEFSPLLNRAPKDNLENHMRGCGSGFCRFPDWTDPKKNDVRAGHAPFLII